MYSDILWGPREEEGERGVASLWDPTELATLSSGLYLIVC